MYRYIYMYIHIYINVYFSPPDLGVLNLQFVINTREPIQMIFWPDLNFRISRFVAPSKCCKLPLLHTRREKEGERKKKRERKTCISLRCTSLVQAHGPCVVFIAVFFYRFIHGSCHTCLCGMSHV